MSSATATLEELSPVQRQRNRDAATLMVKDRWYRFDPPAEAVPLERRVRGVKKAGKLVQFSRGKYMGWREEYEEHKIGRAHV